MAPVTFHGGPLHGVTVDTDGPWPSEAHDGTYRHDGASFVYEPHPDAAAASQEVHEPDVVHVRPAEPVHTEHRPRTRKVTRR